MSQNLPARQDRGPPETAVQKRDREARAGRAQFLTAVIEQRESFERSLKVYDLDFDVFMASVEVGVERIAMTQPEFFLEVPMANFLREVARAAHVGLKPDGKQGAIVKFAKDCTFMPMVEGYVEIIWKTGLVKDINHNVVCEGDEFDFQEGDEGYVRHRRSLTRPKDAVAIGAWCAINLMTGGKMIEIVDQADLERIAKVNNAAKGPRNNGWHLEMHRKAPFRRMTKRFPKTERIAALIELDDRHVKLEGATALPDDAPDHRQLFGQKPIRRKAPAALEAPKDEVVEVLAPDLREKEPAGGPPVEDAGQQEADNSAAVDRAPSEREEGTTAAADRPFVLRAVLSKKNGLQAFDNAELWYGDLRQKMRTLPADLLPAFWSFNRPHVEEAGRHGHGVEAMKLLELATELGLMGGHHD